MHHRNIPQAFPELGYMPEPLRDLILWHRGVRVPPSVGGVRGVQPGRFASARCFASGAARPSTRATTFSWA